MPQASVMSPKLSTALHRVLGSPSYKAAAVHVSVLMKAERWSAADKAASASPVAVATPRTLALLM